MNWSYSAPRLPSDYTVDEGRPLTMVLYRDDDNTLGHALVAQEGTSVALFNQKHYSNVILPFSVHLTIGFILTSWRSSVLAVF